jgi:hypothetical protein
MPNEFEAAMFNQTDADLIRIISSEPGDFRPAAVEAAGRELSRRNLSEVLIIAIKQDIEHKQRLDRFKAKQPLGTGLKILSCIFPGIIQLMFAGMFKADGYDRKAKEMLRWTMYGLGFYMIGMTLTMILSKIL